MDARSLQCFVGSAPWPPNASAAGPNRCAVPSKSRCWRLVRCAKGATAKPGQGFGAKAAQKTVLDAGILLRRSEQLYDQLIDKNCVDGKAREFVVCVRQSAAGAQIPKRLNDWLPVAELVLVSDLDAADVVPSALHTVCREIAECAVKGAPSLRQIPRSSLEYAYEPAGDFYELVLGSVRSSQDRVVTNECPYEILGLPRAASASQVRSAYRILAAKYHPDSNPGSTDDDQYKKVVSAYERIKLTGFTASRDYGYAALGGNSRQGFSTPVTIDTSKVPTQPIQVAVRQLDPEIITLFSARRVAS